MSSRYTKKSIQNSYFANENYHLLFKILHDDIDTRFNINIHDIPECRKKLIQSMNNTYQKNHNSRNLVDLNKKTILSVAPQFYQIIQNSNTRKEKGEGGSVIRDLEIPTRDMPDYTSIARPDYQSDLKNRSSEKTISQFDKITQERDLEHKQNIPETPNFQESINFGDEELTPEQMVHNFSNLQSQRDNDLLKVFPDTKNNTMKESQDFKEFQKQLHNFEQSQQVENEKTASLAQQKKDEGPKVVMDQRDIQSNLIEQTNKGSRDNKSTSINSLISMTENSRGNNDIQEGPLPDISDSSLTNRREVDVELQRQPHDPKKYLEHQEKFKKNLEQDLQTSQTHIHVHDPGDHIQQTQTPSHEIAYNFEINSMDRDISVDQQHRFQFQVNLGTSPDEWIRVPLYENNPTVPATPEQAEKGERGFNNGVGGGGWTWGETGESFSEYDPSKPSGNIVGYESIKSSGNSGAVVPREFKNISKIELLGVLIPNEYIWDHTSVQETNSSQILQYPYLVLSIEELDKVYLSTNKNITKAFCKLMYDGKKRHLDNTQNYLNYVPGTTGNQEEGIKKFIPAPLANLNRMKISILTPQGKVLSELQDVVKIQNITIDDPPSTDISSNSNITGVDRFLKITLSNFVNNQIFQSKHQVLIKNYTTTLDVGETRTQNLIDFESFINRIDGHRIISTGTTVSDTLGNHMINIIYIENKGAVSDSTGLWSSYWSNAQIAELNGLLEDDDAMGGILFHINHQCHFSFRLHQLEYDVSNLPVRTI